MRIRNEPKEDPEKDVPFSTRKLVPCLQEGAERFGWDKRQARPGSVRDGHWLVGLGVAAAIRGNFLRPAEARVTMQSAQKAVVEMDMTDIGTGSYTIFAQIAAEMLDMPVENVEVRLGHSSYPVTPGSGGSFGAASCGAALHDACLKLKARLDAGEGPQGLSVTGQVKPGDEYKKYSQYAYGAHFAEVGVDGDHRRGAAAPHAGRVRRRPHPQRQDRALAADRRHDLGRELGAATRTPSSIRASASSSTRISPTTTCRCMPTSARSRP